MPSIKTLTHILGGRYYHIFNRGINRQLIFYQKRNYHYFLFLIKKILVEYVDILAFCLLPNHFHLVIRIKDVIFQKDDILEIEKERFLWVAETKGIGKIGMSSLKKDDILVDEIEIGNFVTNQLRRLFITYSMAINKQENRTGNFFDRSFKRLEITTQDYLEYAIFYTHFNPEKHGIISNFKDYKYSSYKAIITKYETNVSRNFVLDLFGERKEFINYHAVMHEEHEDVVLE